MMLQGVIYGDLKLWELADILAEIRKSWSSLSAIIGVTGAERVLGGSVTMELVLQNDQDLLLKVHLTEYIYRICKYCLMLYEV